MKGIRGKIVATRTDKSLEIQFIDAINNEVLYKIRLDVYNENFLSLLDFMENFLIALISGMSGGTK